MKTAFVMVPLIEGGVVHVNMNLVTTVEQVTRAGEKQFTVLLMPERVVRTTFTPQEIFDLMEDQP